MRVLEPPRLSTWRNIGRCRGVTERRSPVGAPADRRCWPVTVEATKTYTLAVESGSGSLPTGIVTFLLTDVEASSSLWETDAAVVGRALVMHDATIATAVADAGGKILKARGEGDSTFSVFARPTQGVRAAIVARR